MQNVLEVKGLTKNTVINMLWKMSVFPSIKEKSTVSSENGAGKTTLIKIITQVIHPRSGGTVSVLGSEPTRMDQSPQPYWICHRDSCSSCPHVGLWKSALLLYRPGIPNADKVIKETLQYVGLTDTGKKNSAISLWGWDSGWALPLPFWDVPTCSFWTSPSMV